MEPFLGSVLEELREESANRTPNSIASFVPLNSVKSGQSAFWLVGRFGSIVSVCQDASTAEAPASSAC